MASTVIDRITGLGASVAVKAPARLVSLVNVPVLAGLLTIDAVVVAADDRILLAGQTNATQNGIYIASATDWKRAPDADGTDDLVRGTRVFVWDGAHGAEYQCTTTGQIVPGTTPIAFAILTSGASGAPTDVSYVVLAASSGLSAERVLTGGTGIGLTDAGAGGNITVAVNDAELLALAGLTSAANKLPYFTGAGTAALTDLSAFARTLIDDADAAAMFLTLGLATAILSPAAALVASQPLTLQETWNNAGTAFVAFKLDITSTASAATSKPIQVMVGAAEMFSVRKDGLVDAVTVQAQTSVVALNGSAVRLGSGGSIGFASTGFWFDTVDTSITRVSAGLIAVQGSNVLMASNIGVTVQAYDTELAALAGLTSAADKLPYFTGAGTAAVTTFTAFARTLVDDPDAATALTTLGAQPLDSDLTTIAGLTATTNNFIQSKSSAWASRTPTQVTADLDAMTGGGGTGLKGLVPAQVAGDVTKFLRGDATFQTVPLTAGGSNTYVQFNDGGVLGGDADLTWDKTNNILNLASNGAVKWNNDSGFKRDGAVNTIRLEPSDPIMRFYGVDDGAGNYERGMVRWDNTAHEFQMGTEKGGTGSVRIFSYYVGGTLTAALFSAGFRMESALDIYWNARAVINSPADGQLLLLNNAKTNFTRLQFGGTTNAFPSLKRNGTGLDVRLSDDSAYAPLAASLLGAGGAVSTAALIAIAAGSATVAPLQMTSGTSLTTAAAGAQEYDGVNFYATPAASSRAVNITEYIARLHAAYTLTSTTSAQKIFNVPTNGALTLPVGAYMFEALVAVDTMSATSGNAAFSLAGTATVANILQAVLGIDGAKATAGAADGASWSVTAAVPSAAASAVTAGTATEMFVLWKGSFEISGTGTIIPSIALITAAAAVVKIGSYFRCWPVMAATTTTVGNWG